MTSHQTTRLSPESRISFYYFCQSMSVGASNAFLGIWLAWMGMNPEQIGLIYTAPVVVLLIVSLTIGRIADRANDWRQVIVVGALASGLFPIGLFFAKSFLAILIVWTLASATQWGTTSIQDAAALRLSRRRGTDFGFFRACGTVSYLLVIVVSGYLLDIYGVEIFLPLFAGLCLVRSAASLALPKFRAGEAEEVQSSGAARLIHVLKPVFLLPLLGWSLVYSTHLVLNAFLGLVLIKQGISTDYIGLLISLGAAAEAAMFFGFKKFAHRFRPLHLILISCLVSIIRWLAMAFEPGFAMLFALQLLHAITYALGFIACVNFIANQTSEDIAAEAQGLFTVLQLATGIVAVTSFGWMTASWGTKAFLASAAVAAFGAGLVMLSVWRERREQTHERL